MDCAQLGVHGPRVGRLGIGTCFMAASGQAEITRLVHTALELGVTHFDSAPDYGKGNDERLLGEGLRGVRDRAFLATKVGYPPEPTGHRDAAALMRQFEGSLARLQTDRVDLIQVHEADFLKWWVDQPLDQHQRTSHWGERMDPDAPYDLTGAPVLAFLQAAKASGKARYVGLTGKNARRLARLLRTLHVDTVMLAHDYNVILRNGDEFLFPLTQQQQLGVILAAVLMKGWLAVPQESWRTAPPPWMTPPFSAAYFAYLELARASGLPLVEVSLRWLLGRPGWHDVLVGCATAAEATQNAAILAKGSLPPDLQAAITAIGIVHPLIYQDRHDL